MDKKKWDLFFDLLCDIVDESGTYDSKRAGVLAAAAEYGEGAENSLDEFIAWFE